MKIRRIFVALLCFVIFATTTTQVFAASGSYNFSGTDGTLYAVTKSNAPLRAESHDQGKVLAKLQTGQVINVSKSFKTSKGTTWLEVKCFKDGQAVIAYLYSGNATQLYYKKYTGTSGSIVTVCNSLGIDSSYNHRKKIAIANGITNYSGTASQNTGLVRLAKEGKLIRSEVTKTIFDTAPVVNTVSYFPRYTGTTSSIVTALKAVGADSSYSYRAKIAAANGITNYSGTAEQNLRMVSLLKSGKLVKPGTTTAGTTTSSTNNKPTQNTNTGSTGNTGKQATLVNAGADLKVKNKGKENGIKYASYEGQRSAAAYNTVIDQYFVETNSRYARTSTSTYCNIFASDVMLAMGLEGDYSHWLKNNAPSNSNTKGAYELNANETYKWINNYGSKYGWTKVSAEEAQERANAGYPTIGIWKNPTGKSGHVVVIRPEGNGFTYSAAKGPVIAQAGANNFNYGNISKGFSKDKMPDVQYWTHA